MKVAFVTADAPGSRPTGYHAHTLALLKALQRRHDVTLLCYDRAAPAALSIGGKIPAPWDRVAELRSFLGGGTRVESHFIARRVAVGVRRALDAGDFDRVLFNHLRAAWVLPRVLPLGVPAAYVAHNSEAALAASAAVDLPAALRPLAKREARRLAALEADVAAAAGFAAVMSPEDGARLRFLAPRLDVTLVAPAPPPLPRGARRQAARAAAAPTGLLLVGSFHWRPKRANAVWLVREVLPLVQASRAGADLLVAGSGASHLARLAGPLVRLRPDPAEVASLYDEGRIAVVPERQVGGVKLKVLEAAAHGAPIVATSAGVEGTGLRDGRDCLVADGAADFAQAIVRLLSEPGLARQLGDSARRQVARRPADGIATGIDTLLRRMGRAP